MSLAWERVTLNRKDNFIYPSQGLLVDDSEAADQKPGVRLFLKL